MQALSLLLSLAVGMASAQTVSFTVNTGTVLHGIDEKIYGQSLEPVYHSVDGGLWGDVVWNRGFEETLAQGVWRVNGGILGTAGGNADSRFRLGDETWRDYDLSVDVLRPAGSGIIVVAVRSHGNANYALLLGGAGGFELTQTADDRQTGRPVTIVLQTAAGQTENGRWYRVRVRIEGARLEVWMDGKGLFGLSTTGGSANGQAFVGARSGAASFANLSVKSAGGRPLFGGVPTAARYWYAAGTGAAELDTGSLSNSSQSLRIVSHEDDSGIEQHGYAVRAGDALRGSLWLSGSGPGLVVRLLDGGKVLAEQTVAAPSEEWKEFPLLLNPTASSQNATLRILARPRSEVKLDRVSLMPDSYRANGGFRPDLTQAVAALHPPIILWPGGSLAGNYKWKDGIGPRSKRVDPLAFGVDEFLALARKVGAEPMIAIPVSARNQGDRAAMIQDAVDFVAYCNGRHDSAWGKVRAQNGYPEPYRVKYWEIDNAKLSTADYAEALGQFVPAMRKVDPAIRIVARDLPGLEGASGLIPDMAHLVNYLSVQRYEYPERFAEGTEVTKFWKSLEEDIAKSKNPRLKLFVSGWKTQIADWGAGLYVGGILNAMERDEAIAMAARALRLRHVTAPSPDNALIHFDQSSWFPSPDYVVMKLYRDHFAPDLLEIAGDLGDLSATATRTADGERIYLKLVNVREQEVSVEVALRGDFPLLAASMQVVAPDSLAARNTLEQPAAIQAVDAKVERAGMTARFRLPRWSVAVVTLSR